MKFSTPLTEIISNGRVYSRSHFQPQRIILHKEGVDQTDLIVRLSFQTHVYSVSSTGLVAGEATFNDEGGSLREFCPERYSLSLSLPNICQSMIENNYPTWESKDRNKASHMTVTEFPVQTGDKYHIFYEVFPSLARGVHIELSIKSAYSKFLNAAKTGRRSKVKQIIKKSYYDRQRYP